MKSKFTTIIMNIVIILIISVFALFGYIFFEEFVQLQTSIEPENFQTTISENSNTIDTNIETPQIIENPLDDIEQSQENAQKVDYSNVQVDKYFYNQLEDNAKTIYKALEANQKNLKTIHSKQLKKFAKIQEKYSNRMQLNLKKENLK